MEFILIPGQMTTFPLFLNQMTQQIHQIIVVLLLPVLLVNFLIIFFIQDWKSFQKKKNLINPSQIGFTKNARSADHVFILKTLIEKYCHQNNGRLFCCFIDFNKAFDSVVHTGLKLKLIDMNVGTKFYNIICAMYKNSKACVN